MVIILKENVLEISEEIADIIGYSLSDERTRFVIKENTRGYHLPQLTMYLLDYDNGVNENQVIEPVASPLTYNFYYDIGSPGKYITFEEANNQKADKWILTGNITINLLFALKEADLISDISPIAKVINYIELYKETIGHKLTEKDKQTRRELKQEIDREMNISQGTPKVVIKNSLIRKYKQANGTYQIPEDKYIEDMDEELEQQLGEYSAERQENMFIFTKV